MNTYYDYNSGKWLFRWPESISHHDVVFLSPVDDPAYGIPIGDGDTGVLIWPEKDKLKLVINKSDLYDFNGSRPFSNWAANEEEYTTSLRQAAQFEIQFAAPVFDLIYQKDYEARICLADASGTIHAKTPFSDVYIRAFSANREHTTVLQCDAVFDDAGVVRTLMERWGSRTFSHWYSLVKRDPSIGLSGTKTDLRDNRIFIEQELNGNAFCAAAAIETDLPHTVSVINSRGGEFTLSRSDNIHFTVYITVASGNDTKEARLKAADQLSVSVKTGKDEIYKCHSEEWHAFWERSSVRIPDDYIENLWYLTMYYSNSNSRGSYPSHFCNGLWGFQHDFVPWNFFFHYNMQLASWPLHAANHSELILPYLDYRFRQLPDAIKHAEICKGIDAALYTDVASADGSFDKNTEDNLTPGPQIAEMMWQHWIYTGDMDFLRIKAWPVIRETAKMYASLVVLENGSYHIFSSQAYEGSFLMNDSITDHSMMRVIFKIALECIKTLRINEPNKDKWHNILDNLLPFELIPMEDDEYRSENGQDFMSSGIGIGNGLLGKNVLGVGRLIKGQNRDFESAYEDSVYWKNKPDGSVLRQLFISKKLCGYYGFPDVELSPVFPAGLIGLSDKGTPLFNALVNQVRMHGRCTVEDEISLKNKDSVTCMGWCMHVVVLARLGLAEELEQSLRDTANAWQMYANGFGHYGPYLGNISDNNLRFHTNTVRDANDPSQKFMSPSWPFRHFDFEMLPILATAVNEMLLQSFEGCIRVFPACREKQSAGFKLRAQNGLIADAQMIEGKVLFVSFTADNDAHIRLVSPWTMKNAVCSAYSNNMKITEKVLSPKISGVDHILEIDINRGQRCIITEQDTDLSSFTQITEPRKANKNYKKLGRAALGVPRMF
jgi:alpha-L-fucosidase 2